MVRVTGLEPVRRNTRPSNVPVCQFQHTRSNVANVIITYPHTRVNLFRLILPAFLKKRSRSGGGFYKGGNSLYLHDIIIFLWYNKCKAFIILAFMSRLTGMDNYTTAALRLGYIPISMSRRMVTDSYPTDSSSELRTAILKI